MKKRHKRLALGAMAVSVAIPTMVAVTQAEASSITTVFEDKLVAQQEGDIAALGVKFKAQEGYFAERAAISTAGDLYTWNKTPYYPRAEVLGVKFKQVGNSGGVWYAISLEGKLYTWGDSTYGALGQGTLTSISSPTENLRVSNVKDVKLTKFGMFIITENGDVYYTGTNETGLAGSGTTETVNRPVKVPGLSNVVDLKYFSETASTGSALAITSTGELYGWGNGSKGLNGVSSANVLTPTKIEGVSNVKKFHYKYKALYPPHILWLETGNGELYGLGQNYQSGVGGGSTDAFVYTPTKVQGITSIKSFKHHAWTSAVVTENGDLYVWGNNTSGQIGNGVKGTHASTPYKVPLANVKDVEVTGNSILAVLENGDVYTWGSDGGRYILGTGSATPVLTPQKLTGLPAIDKVFEGSDSVGALAKDGSFYTWGFNGDSQAGNGGTSNVSRPYKVNIPAVAEVLRWGNTQVVKTTDNNIYGWGYGGYSTPQKYSSASNITDAYYDQANLTLAMTDVNGKTYLHGDASKGRLGDNNSTVLIRPTYGFFSTITGAQTSDITFEEKEDGTLGISWEPINGATKYRVKRNGNGGVWIHDGLSTSFNDKFDIQPNTDYTYTFEVTTSKGATTSTLTFRSSDKIPVEEPPVEEPPVVEPPVEEPPVVEPPVEEPTEPPKPVGKWTFDNPTGDTERLKRNVTIVGGKKVVDMVIEDIEYVSKETTVTTELGDIILKPDGKGNTLLTIPNGLGTSETSTKLKVEYEGVNFLDIKIQAVPKIEFNFKF